MGQQDSWIKFFYDGTKEEGTDQGISSGEASWSKGRLSDIKEVSLSADDRVVLLRAPKAEWHQFDKFAVRVAVGKHQPARTHRVLQARIAPEYVGGRVYFSLTGKNNIAVCELKLMREPVRRDVLFVIERKHIGKWLTVVLESSSRLCRAGIFEKGKIA